MALHLHRAERTDLLADGLGALLADPLPDPFAEELVAKLAMQMHNAEWYAALAPCATIVPAQANPRVRIASHASIRFLTLLAPIDRPEGHKRSTLFVTFSLTMLPPRPSSISVGLCGPCGLSGRRGNPRLRHLEPALPSRSAPIGPCLLQRLPIVKCGQDPRSLIARWRAYRALRRRYRCDDCT
jgi:hypothetical protein